MTATPGIQRLVDTRGLTVGYRTWDPVLGLVDTISGAYETLTQFMERRRAAIQSGAAPTQQVVVEAKRINLGLLSRLTGNDNYCGHCGSRNLSWYTVQTDRGETRLAQCHDCSEHSRSFLNRYKTGY
jgi:DNA-directed RNA polymerase subunit M/transcription elongation factor TFIIS